MSGDNTSGDDNNHGLTDPLRAAGESISGAAQDAAKNAIDGITGGENPLDHAQDFLGEARDKALGAGAGVIGGAQEWAQGKIGAAGEAVSGVGESLTGAAGSALGKGKEWLYGASGEAEDAVDRAEAAHGRLDFNETDRLPWLESDEDEEYQGVDTKKVIGAVIGGVGLLGAIVGGLWVFTHHRDAGAPVADGSVIAAPSEPVKEAPKDAGGKQFAGTGDSSFAVSQGQSRTAHLAGGENALGHDGVAAVAAGAAEVAASTAAAAGASFAGGGGAAAKPTAAAAATPKPAAVAAAIKPTETAGPAGGVVQIAAYSSEASAQAGWNRLVIGHDVLKGQNHRIVSAKIDMGTVYRLQLVTSAGGGTALCERLKADGLACQVKH